MIYLMSIEMFNKLSNGNNRFAENNGYTYKEYILKNCNISNTLKSKIINSNTSQDALNLLNKNNIIYTHNYLESKLEELPNIELEINKINK